MSADNLAVTPAEFKEMWLEALRSGEYGQTRFRLYSRGGMDFGGDGYCCLGVAAKVLGLLGDDGMCRYGDAALERSLPNELCVILRMSPDLHGKLADMNDSGESFAEIASAIEKDYQP